MLSLKEYLSDGDTVELSFTSDGHDIARELEDRGVRIIEMVDHRHEVIVTINKEDHYRANQILKAINADTINEEEEVEEADVNRLEEIKDEIKELVAEAEDIIRGSYEYRAAKSYWIAHILTALDNESEYMGKSMTAMQDTIDNLKNPGADHVKEDNYEAE